MAADSGRANERAVSPRCSALLGLSSLALFIWQFVITRTIVANDFGSMDMYYYGRSILALVCAVVSLKTPAFSDRAGTYVSVILGLAAAIGPLVLVYATPSQILSYATCIAAGAGASWMYLLLFLMYSRMRLHSALAQLFGSLAAAHLCRIGLDLVPLSVLPLIGFVAVAACIVVAGYGYRMLGSDVLSASGSDVAFDAHCGGRTTRRLNDGPNNLFPIVVMEFVVFGFVAGLVRTPYEMNQFDPVVNTLGSILVALMTVAFLCWALRMGTEVHLHIVCQGILLLLLTVLLALVLFGGEDSVTASIASLFARYGVYTLLLYVLLIFISREGPHPFVTFGFGWGFFTLATGLGISVASMIEISRFSSIAALAIAYALVIASFIASTGTKGDDLLFAAEGTAAADPREGEHGRMQSGIGGMTIDDIMEACESLGLEHGLTRREIEVVQHICLGRSKSYIAEKLMISENTARGYAKNAYRKLDIHSRQELLTLVGIE